MAYTNNILASGISNIDHLAAFDIIAAKRFSNIQLERLLVYIIDTVDTSAIPHLATQFDVLGFKGMKLAATDAQQRSVIKNAIRIKRKAGTLWAVKQAMIAIGYPDMVFIENAGTDPTYGWAQFRLQLNAGNNQITDAMLNDIISMLDIYKRKSSHLLDVSYNLDMSTDSFSVADESFESPSIDDSDVLFAGGDFRHDGKFLRDGEKNHSTDTDILEIQIINV